MNQLQLKRRPAASLGSEWEQTPPLLARVLAARGAGPAQARLALQDLLPPTLKGIDQAAAILEDGVRRQLRLVCASDYDCDGAGAATIFVLGLHALGAEHVDYVVPDRFTMGYGLSPGLVDRAIEKGAQVLVTADSGISSLAGVRYARDRGLTVIVTDHHLAGSSLPDADAIVNPNQPGCTFASKSLAGVGCLFYVLLALRARLKACGWFETRPEPNLAELLEVVALSTVADVVPLDHNNRILVRHGLNRLRAGSKRPGLKALLQVSGTQAKYLTATDLGFRLGPRLNASGRLEDITVGIQCLLSDDPAHALELAKTLDDLNRQRRSMQQDMSLDAMQQVGELPGDQVGVVVFDEGFHEGIVGLIASKVREAVHRPVAAFARGADDGMLKGSCRSVPGLHVRDALAMIDGRNPGLIHRFGGHAAAAGLSLEEDRLAEFEEAFDWACRELATPQALQRVLETDGVLESDDLNLETARLLEDAGPWGQGFGEPVFEGAFQVRDYRLMGTEEQHVRYRLVAGRRTVEAVHFNGAEQLQKSGILRAAFRLSINRWQDREDLQLMIDTLI